MKGSFGSKASGRQLKFERLQPLQSSLLNCRDKFWLKLVDKKGWNGGILLEKTYIFPAAHI